MGDLTGGSVRPSADGADGELALADHGGGECGPALAAGDWKPLTGDGLLVDGSEAFDDLAIDWDHLAWVDDDEIAGREFCGGDRRDLAIAQDPRALRAKFQELADGTTRAGRGEVADPVAELDQPSDERASQRIGLND